MMTRSAHIKALKESMKDHRGWWEMNIRIYKNNLKDDGKICLADPDGDYRSFSKDFILGLWESIYPTTPKVVKKVAPKVIEKKVETMNVDAILASLNNVRNRNAELVHEVSKTKNEVKVANDEIASLKTMLALAYEKIASLEKDNEELAIYKEMVEEETKIAA